MLNEEIILKQLSKIIDPDFNQDIVSLGFVQNILIDNDIVSFKIELTTPACPYRPIFKKKAEELITNINGVREVHVTMTARKNERTINTENSGLKNVKYILAVSSCKGGVGKSTISTVIAKLLASRGLNVGLLDADIYGPSIPTLFNLHQPGVKATEDNKFFPNEIDGLKLMSFGFLMGDNPAVIRGPMVSQYAQQLLHNVLWGELDYLIIDMPPGTGDIQLTISQSVQIDSSIIVTTPHQLSLTDVKKGIMMFDKVNIPVLGVIENMSFFECPDTLKKHYIFGKAGAHKLQNRFGLETLIELPIINQFSFNDNEILKNNIANEMVNVIIRSIGKKIIEKPIQPKIMIDENNINLYWSDEDKISISNNLLRKSCACALCIDEMTRKPLLDPNSIPDDIHAKKVNTIGNYAILIDWSDGHNTGFYPFNMLRDLAKHSIPKNKYTNGCNI